ncbi:hypothetical protein DFQ27_003170, partial [Actinomortierella ambigua]
GFWGVREVAIKKFNCLAKEATLEPIKQEIDMLKRLSYRHIIQFYGETEIDEELVLVTDLAEGGSLRKAIKSNLIPPKAWSIKFRIAQEIARGLAYIHSEGVLHLDLKSDNVLLTRYLEVKLCDFGMSQVKTSSASRSPAEAKVKGTYRWMAPEILETKKPKYSTKSDVYSLGVVMWELAAHCTVPFEQLHDASMVVLVIKRGEREDLPDDTPSKYRFWVKRCWDHIPANRPEAHEVNLNLEEGIVKHCYHNSHDHTFFRAALSSSLLSVGHHHTAMVVPEIDGSLHRPGTHSSHYVDTRTINSQSTGIVTNVTKSQNQSPTTQALDEAEREFMDLYCRAMRGDHEAQNRVADLLLNGIGVPKSESEAFMWFQRAADGGIAYAQASLALLYVQGRGVEKNNDEALRWVTMAVAQGCPTGQALLGWMHENGLGGVERDDLMAEQLYRKAADQGSSTAQCSLGWMYLHGRGVEQSDNRAVEWFRKAAEQEDPRAESALGMLSFFGDGLRENEEQAAALCRKSGENGDYHGRFYLGLMHELGIGLAQDDEQAKLFFYLAADRGRKPGMSHISWISRSGRRREAKSRAEIAALYIKGANEGIAAAQFGLGVLYDKGRGVERSKAQALAWYTKAAEQGHQFATDRVEFLGSV